MTDFLTIGLLLGLTAGLAPGPLLTLVISESLRHGIRAGMAIALAPIITDLPIILLTLFVISKLSGLQSVLGIISLAGGVFILYTGYSTVCTKAEETAIPDHQPKSLLKGVAANFMSPYPYLFWISVGGPTMSKALNLGAWSLIVFIAGFYATLIGSKIFLAVAVGKSRAFLSGKVYLYSLRFLGLLLCMFSLVLFRDGLKLLGLL